jgi:hypothetical protein
MNKGVAAGATAIVAITGFLGGLVGHATANHPRLYAALFSVENEATKILRSGFSCGVQRWSVKTLSDPAAQSINFAPKRTNIPYLRNLTAPSNPTSRVPNSAETQLWRIAGTRLVAYKEELDSDIHLKLQSTINGTTMIAEIPDPNCVTNPTYRAQIATARDNFVTEVGQPYGYYVDTNKRITISGVGFFDFIHGQNGVAPNGIELHPVLTFRVWVS